MNLNRLVLLVTPMKLNVKAWKAPEVIRRPVAKGQIGAEPEANLAPFELNVIRQDLGEASMGDRLAEESVDTVVEATQQLSLFVRAGPTFQAPPVVVRVVVAREDHGSNGGP